MFNEDLKTKKILVSLVSLFLFVLIVFFIAKSLNEIEKRNYIAPENTINVSGKGEIFIRPDIAQISLSVEKEAISVFNAQKNATEAINKVVAFLKQSGIEDKDIKTTNYNIYPRYDYLEKQGRVLRGYVVSQTLEVKIRKIDDVGKILAGATLAGANQIGGVSFTIDDEEAVKREARQKAIADAKTKAEQLAKDLGVKIVRLISFNESGNGYYLPSYAESARVLGMGGGEAPEIPSGENKITAVVGLTYQIK